MTGRIIAGSQVCVAVSDESGIGECRRSARRFADAFQFDEVCAGRIGIIATELATNILRHAERGEILIQVLDDGMTPELELLAVDKGPGMQDVDACIRDGYSTGGTAGCGLGAVSRLSSTFDVFSAVGQGTVVLSRTERKPDTAHRGIAARRSDGVSARWSLSAYPGLYRRHSAVVAAVLYRDFARRRDDATVIVARLRP